MKEKLTLFVVAVFLLILIVIKISIFVPNIPGKQISIRNDEIVIKAQTNAAVLNWTLSSINIRRKQINGFTTGLNVSKLLCHQFEILAKNILNTNTKNYDNNYFNVKNNSLKIKNILKNLQNDTGYRRKKNSKLTQFSSEVVTFMVAITFVKLVIVVIAYQQLLHNGYIIIQNLYHKHIRQFELLICNRPYQLKSGHGLDDDENYLVRQKYQPQLMHEKQQEKQQPQQQKGKQQILKQVNKVIENIVSNGQYSETEQYGSIEKEKTGFSALKILNSNNNQLYHQQQQLKHPNYYQQIDYNHYHHSKHHQNHRYYQYYYHENHRCFYQRDQQCYQGYCHQVDENLTNEHHHHAKPRMLHEKFTSVSPVLPLKSKWPKSTTSLFKSKMSRVCNDHIDNIPTAQQTTPVIPSLASLSSTICCWKTTGNRKRRKRKTTFGWDKYARNCNYLIWRRSCPCNCCCFDDGLCDIFSRYSEYFYIHCYRRCDCLFCCCCCCYCICEINSKTSMSQTSALNYKFCKNNLNLTSNSASLHKNTSHQLNIINISKDVRSSSRNASRKWCIDAGHHSDNDGDSGSNLLRSLNAVKDMSTTAVHNRNYKRKLKKNLVWLFIGLVWLEGPKLINCSISHNNNDVTSISGNETTNKIGSSQSSNSDNSSGSSGNGGGRNGSRGNGGSSSNTNGPGPSPRPDSTESKGQNVKSANLLKITNSLGNSGINNIEGYNKNRFMQNTISIEQPLHIKKQYQYQTFHQQDRNQQREPYVVSRTGYNSDRLTGSRSTLFESEEVNRAQSDLVRLESIKRQILTKLGLTEKPNVTHPLPKQFIWDTIYRADGIRSVSDFDFNDNHRTQEHMRLTAAVLEPPPLIPHHYPPIVNSITEIDDIRTNRLRINTGINANYSNRTNDVSSTKNILDASWKLLNLTTEQAKEHDEQILSKYQRKHRQQQQQQRLRGNNNSHSQSKNRYSEPDYFEGDDFFGSTQEIITFAEKGKIYKKHRLVEFSPPSNKIPKQKLQIRNAEIHIRIEKVSTRSSLTTGQLEHRHLHRHKYASSREPNLKIWIFQLVGNDFSSKGFDQVATLCTSLSVDHNVLGWQKLDITETVQFWYGKHQKDKLRLLIDCTGCGSRYILHLFDRKFHHSLLSPSATALREPYHEMHENSHANKLNNTSLKPEHSDKNQTQRYYYHYRQYNHHRYRRKNRASPAYHTPKKLNASETAEVQNQLKQQSNKGGYSPSLWLTTRKYRKSREIKSPNSSQEELEGISYEVGAEYHLEDRLNPNRPFLVLHTEPTRSRRVRRRAVDCSGAMHGQCCKESFYVSFKALGWDDWIIAPRGYFANYCRGDCTGPYRTPDTFQTFHAHFIEEYRKMGLLNGMQPCCAPVKFSSMSLIYYGDDGIIKRDLPKMVVDECGCP